MTRPTYTARVSQPGTTSRVALSFCWLPVGAAMLGVAVTLERTRLNLPREQALDLVGMLVEKTRKLERLLKDLLDLNRLEEGVLEPNRSLTDVRELRG